MNNFEEYRAGLDQLRLTKDSKQSLIRTLTAPQAAKRSRRGWSRAVLAAAVLCIAVATAGAVQVAAPILREYYQNSAGYGQSGSYLGNSVTKDGWTMTLTDCVGDDYSLYIGIELEAPEGTALNWETGYKLERGLVQFPGLNLAGGGDCCQQEDEDPSDNRVHFILRRDYAMEDSQRLSGQRMNLTLGGLYHLTVWNEEEMKWEWEYDCEAVWNFSVTAAYPDNIIRLEPNLPVTTLGVEATITKVEVSPIGVYVYIEGDSLKGHHAWVERNAPDGWYGCIEYQEITLYTTDGRAIPMMEHMAGGGCSGGTDASEPGCLYLARRADTLLDLDTLESICVCGEEIPLR